MAQLYVCMAYGVYCLELIASTYCDSSAGGVGLFCTINLSSKLQSRFYKLIISLIIRLYLPTTIMVLDRDNVLKEGASALTSHL